MSEQHNDDLFAQRRRYSRHSTAIPITVLQPDQDEAANLQILNDVSAGGLSFVSEHAWESDTVLTICFHSPNDMQEELLTLYGQVMWCRQVAHDYFDVGIQFIQPAEVVIEIVSLIEVWYEKHATHQHLSELNAPISPELRRSLPCEEEPAMPLLLAYQPTS